MPVTDAATYPRTLRCWRFLGVVAGVAAFCGIAGTLFLSGATSTRSDPSDLQRAVGGGLFIAFAAACVAFLRTRVVIKDSGITVVWGFHRRHLAWDEITEITADAAGTGQGWYLQVRTADREHAAAAFITTRGKAPESGTRLYEPSTDEPYGLYKLHAELWEEWQRRVT